MEMRSDIYRDIPPVDMVDLRRYEATIGLIGGNYHTKEFLASEGGHRYVKLFKPLQHEIQPLLDKISEPSVLLLRGCDLLLQPFSDFPFHRFKSLTSLEISDFPLLPTLPDTTISEMIQLQSLHLSNLPCLDQLPNDLFSNLLELQSIVIRDCSSLQVLPEPQLQTLSKLEFLDLSRLPIQTLPVGFLSKGLRSLVLRGCSELHTLPAPSFGILYELAFLDLFQCTSLHTSGINAVMLRVLDLSYTIMVWSDFTENSVELTHLSQRNAKGSRIMELEIPPRLWVCDLSGCHITEVIGLQYFAFLEVFDLSRTDVEAFSVMFPQSIRILILGECTRLQQLPEFEPGSVLQVLDISGCVILDALPESLCNKVCLIQLNLSGCSGIRELREGLFDQMPHFEKLDISDTKFQHLPSLPNPSTLVIRDKPDLVSLNRNDHVQGEINEFHLVSTFTSQRSGFDQFKIKFNRLNYHLTSLESDYELNTSAVDCSAVKRRFKRFRSDLQYILDHMDMLVISDKSEKSEELLLELVNYKHDHHHYIYCCREFSKLLRVVAKLKILVMRRPNKKFSVEEGYKKKKVAEIYKAVRGVIPFTYDSHLRGYESLTNTQKNCLLYFGCLSIPEWKYDSDDDFVCTGYTSIKDSTLIDLWYAEGLLDPFLEQFAMDEDGANQPASTTIQKIGQQVLQVLKQRFEIGILEGQGKDCSLTLESFCFLRLLVQESQLFDFDQNGKHTPHFTISQRACLVQYAVDNSESSSSSQLWLNYTNSYEKLETFKSVRSLLYIDEDVVEINTKWFSMMENLSVLHLTNLGPGEQIDIVDVKFLEELQKMKQLKLISLEGFAAIQELPSSICVLSNLEILKLGHCSHLEKLPADIGSLVGLFYLDMTQCHLLSEVPKGIALLSKLEVLKGFPITYEVDGKQGRKACTLKELLKLDKLRKLNLVVNKNAFPHTRDLGIFKKMKNLCNLSITWKKDYNDGDEPQQSLREHSRWQQLICWKPHTLHNEIDEDEDDKELSSNCLGSLEKLVLCCFPSETAPNWLHPTELQKVERLQIVGGNLKSLSWDDTSETIWKVKTLHLNYLTNFDIEWATLKSTFPDMTYFNRKGSPCIQNFPDEKEMWKP